MKRGTVICIFYWNLLNVYFSRVIYESTLNMMAENKKLKDKDIDKKITLGNMLELKLILLNQESPNS